MIEIIDCEQGTPEWFRARMGIPTASEFKTLIGVRKDARDKVTRRTYMLKLAGEILTGEPMESYQNQHMDRGKEMEAEVRTLYDFLIDADVKRVGFIKNGHKGCSPDSLIGDTGLLEIKTALPHILIDLHTRNDFPPEHIPQCQGALFVTEREWIDLAVYWPKLPLFVKRVHRDEKYIAMLASAVDEFNHELAQVVDYMRRHGAARAA